MKIKDILMKEDGPIQTGTVDKVEPGGNVTIKGADGNPVNVDADQIKTGADGKPTVEIPKVTSGEQVNIQTTSEEYEAEGQHDISLDSWMNSEYAPFDDDSGDYKTVHHKARNFLHGKVHPHDLDSHADRLSREFHGENDMDETHHDTIASGNHPVGGDATDRFINQVRDKGYERSQRTHKGTMSPLSENDELYKWLTIAGLK